MLLTYLLIYVFTYLYYGVFSGEATVLCSFQAIKMPKLTMHVNCVYVTPKRLIISTF